MSSLISNKEKFKEMEEKDREKLAGVLTAPVNDRSPVVPRNVEKVSPVAESTVVVRELEAEWDVADKNGKGNTVESRLCRNESDVILPKRKGVRLEELAVVDAPTYGDSDEVAANAESEGTLIAKEKSGMGRNSDSPVFVRSQSSQATSDIEVVKERHLVEQKKLFQAGVAGKAADPVPEEVTRNIFRVRTSSVCGSRVKDAAFSLLMHTSMIDRQRRKTC